MNKLLILLVILVTAGMLWADVRVNDVTVHNQTNPVVAVDGDHVYVAYQDNSQFQWDVLVAHSADGGQNFAAAVLPHAVSATDQHMPAIAVGTDGALYVAWADYRNGEHYDLYLAVSDDHGATFAEPVPINTVTVATQIEPALAVDADGVIYAAWNDNSRTTSDDEGVRWDVKIAVSDDGGQTFTEGVSLNLADDVFAFFPAVAALDDGAAVVWFDRSYRIWAAVSHDHGLSWSAPMRLNDEDGAYAAHPRIAAADDLLFAVWNDAEESSLGQDPNLVYNSGMCLDVYAAYSIDGGATWTPQFLVNEEPLLNQQNPVVDLHGGELTIAWSDDREVGNYTIHRLAQPLASPWTWPAAGAQADDFTGITLRDWPDLAGGALVWQDYRNGDWDIYFAPAGGAR